MMLSLSRSLFVSWFVGRKKSSMVVEETTAESRGRGEVEGAWWMDDEDI